MGNKRCWTASPLALSRNASNLLIFWGVPLAMLHFVDFVVQSTDPMDSARDLDVVDAFAGGAAISTVFGEDGKKVGRFDLLDGPDGDIMSMHGFFNCVRLVLKLKPRALLFGGPPCSSWVFINRATSRRSASRAMGDQKMEHVRLGNSILARWILLGMIAIARGCRWVTEQPQSSLMTACAYIRYVALVIRPIFWGERRFPMVAFGHRSRKQTKCFGTAPWLPLLYRKLTNKDKRRIAAAKAKSEHAMVIKRVNKKGKMTVQGGPGMKASAQYPKQFARELLKYQKSKEFAAPDLKITAPTPADLPQKVLKAPYRWRHAALTPIREYLKERVSDGTYEPVLSNGLYNDL